MCRDNSLYINVGELLDYYEIPQGTNIDFEPLYHDVAASPFLWPIAIQKDERKLIPALWGYIPYYAKTRKEADMLRVKMVNARAETIFTNGTFKNAVEKRRCIIPSTGFYEHHHEIGGKRKMPYLIQSCSNPLLSFAGIYTNWLDEETGELLTSFAIITTAANDLMEKIHNGGDNPHRMPLMLGKKQVDQWLDNSCSEAELQEVLNYKIPEGDLKAHAVFTVRGKNKLPGDDVIKPYDWPGYSLVL